MRQVDTAPTLCRMKGKGCEPRLWPGKARRKTETPSSRQGSGVCHGPDKLGKSPSASRRSAALPTAGVGLQSGRVTGFFLATKLTAAEKKLDAVVNVYPRILLSKISKF